MMMVNGAFMAVRGDIGLIQGVIPFWLVDICIGFVCFF